MHNMLVYDKEKDLITWSFPESRFWRTETLQKHDHPATPKISVTLPTVDYGGGFNPSGENIIYMHDDDGKPLMTRWDNKTVTRVAIRLDPALNYPVSLPHKEYGDPSITYSDSSMRGIDIAVAYNQWFNQFWEET